MSAVAFNILIFDCEDTPTVRCVYAANFRQQLRLFEAIVSPPPHRSPASARERNTPRPGLVAFFFFLFSSQNRGWDKLVAVLFHGSWTQESQHAVSILQNLAARQQPHHQEQGQHSSSPCERPAHDRRSATTTTAEGTLPSGGGAGLGRDTAEAPAITIPIILAEADVISLIDVADRQAIAGLPSMHVHFGGREIVRFPVDRAESVESLGARIDEVASTICGTGWS